MSSPAHVAVLGPLARLGGAEMSLVELIRHLRGSPRVTVIVPEDGPLREAASRAGAPTHILQWPNRLRALGERAGTARLHQIVRASVAAWPFANRLADLLKSIGADVLVTNGIKAHLVGAMASRRSGVPLIWYLRDGLEGRRMSAMLLRLYANRCSCAIAISEYVKKEFHLRLPSSIPAHVLYNLVDTDLHRPGNVPPPDLRKPPGEIWYGTIGAITPLKGQDLFLEASLDVVRAVPSARFLVVGASLYGADTDAQFEVKLRKYVRDTALEDRVRFLGHRQDIAQVLALLDVLVHSNRGPEGLGRSVLEAMASGVPVVAVDRWGPAEIIRHDETGLLVPWMDSAALAREMTHLGLDGELRRRLATKARAWIMKNLAADQIVEKFRRIVNDVLRSSSTRDR